MMGPLVFFRVYSGVLTARTALHNTTRGVTERPTRLHQMLADSPREMDSIPAGHIGVAVGLKETRTGVCCGGGVLTRTSVDTLCEWASFATGDTLCLGGDPKPVRLDTVAIPPAVYTACVLVSSGPHRKRQGCSTAVVMQCCIDLALLLAHSCV